MLESFKSRMAHIGCGQGQAYLRQSDMIINETFTRDPAFRRVFITHAPSGLDKKKMDAKFFIHTTRNITGDSEDYYLQFRPNVKVPIGAYVDIPDSDGRRQRWLIALRDDRPQFPLYYVLKCNWTLKWVYENKVYKCLGVLRNQNSYNSGLWTDYLTTSVENQVKFWMPTTPYTQTISYDQRIIMNDSGRKIPLIWKTSKVEDIQPIGITKLTFTQEEAVLDKDCGKYGIAGWCPNRDHSATKYDTCKTCPFSEPEYIDAGLEMPIIESPCGKIDYNGQNATLRVGGTAKIFTAMFWNEIAQTYVAHKPFWNISLYDKDELQCSIDLNFDSNQNDGNDKYMAWDVKIADNCPGNIILKELKFDNDAATFSKIDGCEICCLMDENEIFKFHVVPSGDDLNALKLRCSQLYNMVGKIIKISAQNNQGQYTTSVDMEVVS